jgi:hypothetical protein
MTNPHFMKDFAEALAGALGWFLASSTGDKSSNVAESSSASPIRETLPAARHFVYFPQIRQALSAADARYLMEKAPPHVAKQALRERRAVARQFLKGLREDFANLSRMGRIIASMSPEVSHRQEAERLVLSLKFQVLYALVQFRLSTGNLPLEQLEHLTGLVGRLATRMDAAMAKISALSAGQIAGNAGA